MYQNILSAANVEKIRTANIGGSGTWSMDMDPERGGFPEELNCTGPEAVIAQFRNIETPFEAVPRVKVLNVNGHPVIRIPVHGWKLPTPTLEDTLSTFWLLYQLGVEQVVVDASVGGIRAKPWDLVVPDDLVLNNFIKLSTVRLSQELGRDPWVRQANPLCPRLRRQLLKAANRLKEEGTDEEHYPVGDVIDGGVYNTTPPALFETAAEINDMVNAGHTVVGQSTGQEAAAARMCGMCLAVVNPVANYAEGQAQGEWIEEGMEFFYDQISIPIGVITWWTLQEVVEQEHNCSCQTLANAEDLSKFTHYH